MGTRRPAGGIMFSFIAAILTFGLLSLPGWIPAMRARASLGVTVAAGVGSLFLVLLVSASIGAIAGRLPAWSIYVVALAFSAAAYLAGRERPVSVPQIRLVQLAVPALMAAVAIFAYSLAFGTGDDPQIYRAWYNADWFKHLAHTHSATHFGFPLGDIFAGMDRLHYYWLFYLVPGAGASIHGDVEGALLASNVCLVFLFWLLLQESLRTCGLGQGAAALIALFGWFVDALAVRLLLSDNRPGLDWVLENVAVNTSTLDELNTYIPQHTLMMCGLLAFLLLLIPRHAMRYRFVFALAPVVAAGATSTLLGAVIVAICCTILLLLAPLPVRRRLLLAIGTGALALGAVFGFQVLDNTIGKGAMASPLLADGPQWSSLSARLSHLVRTNIMTIGLVIPLGLFGMARAWRHGDETQRRMTVAAIAICLIGLAASFAAAILLGSRLDAEIEIRSRYVTLVGFLIGMALLFANPPPAIRERRLMAIAVGLTVLLVVPTKVLKIAWIGWSGPQFQTAIPADDRYALAHLRDNAAIDALVLQYPEPPKIIRGRDTWVPVFAGRPIPASYRSTSWPRSAPVVERMERYYAGDARLRPGRAIDWVYLSRALHPESYDTLHARLGADPGWEARLDLPGASLFARAGEDERGERE